MVGSQRNAPASLQMDLHVPQYPRVRTASGPARQATSSPSEHLSANWERHPLTPAPQRSYFSAVYVQKSFLPRRGKCESSGFHWFLWRTELLWGPEGPKPGILSSVRASHRESSLIGPGSHPLQTPGMHRGWSLIWAFLLGDQMSDSSQGPETAPTGQQVLSPFSSQHTIPSSRSQKPSNEPLLPIKVFISYKK